MIRPLRIVGSFVVVAAAYCLYSVAAVPFIEPEETLAEQERVTAEERERALHSVSNQRAGLDRWFKPGDWELTSPKILETPQGKLLLRDYHPNHEDPHEVTLKPCTMIFLPEGQFENEEERQRRAIVLRSPEGAKLRFAEPIDLKRGQVGSKIVGGKLLGQVTIRSDQRSPGPEDDLLLLTKEVTFADDQLTTPHLVEFFYGSNQGSGREMRLELTTAAEKAAQPDVAGAKSFSLARDVQMRMESAEVDLFAGGPKPAAKTKAAPKPPVEIACRGPFNFDLRRHVAIFRDHVEVARLNPQGPSDQLACERLSLFFERDPTAAAAADAQGEKTAGKGPMPKLRPRLIIAEGNPVKLDSRSNGVEARGRRLEYNLQNRSGKLLDGKEAVLRQTDPVSGLVREIHARELEFESDPNSPSGPPRRIDARGQGWLRGSPPADPGQSLYVRWSSRLTFQPYEGSQVLSIRGDAHVEAPRSGALDADEIHLWLQRTSAGAGPALAASGTGGYTPEKMTARGHVRIDSSQLTGVVREMNIWFEREPPAPVAAAGAGPAAAPPPEEPKPAERAPPNQRWHVSGDLLKAQALLRPAQTEVKELTLDGHARCAERPLPGLGGQTGPEKPEQLLVITGEQFHLLQPTPDNATVRITGRPAHVEARGMTLVGGGERTTGSIHLHRATNRLWIPGEGSLSLPVEEDMQGRKLARPELLTVVWQGRMDFDGTTAHFQKTAQKQKDVVAYTDEATLKTPELQVVFSEPIRFAGDREGARPQVQRLFCRQGVEIDHRQRLAGKWLSWERMKARDLAYEYRSGDIEADGPGSITRTWIDEGETPAVMPGAKKKPPPARGKSVPRLLYMNATFDDKLTGNQHRETMTLHRRVSAIYGVVERWQASLDPNYPHRLGPEGFLLDCDRLEVAKDGLVRDQAALELLGEGNAVIQGHEFLARCSTVRYASTKDLLVLSGDGRGPARFYRQYLSGSNPADFSAARILYELKLQRLNINDFEALDVMGLQTKGAGDREQGTGDRGQGTGNR